MTSTDDGQTIDVGPVTVGETVTPEVVGTQPAGVEVERHAAGNAALDVAEATAAALPGVPGRDEFLALAMQARVLSLSGAAPKLVRNDPYIAFHVAMVGRDLGISPSAALELIDVIDTRGGPRISLSPQLLNGQIRRLGLGAIRPKVQDRKRCVAQAVGPNGEVLGETEFTWEDAQDAGLAGPSCEPGDHRKNRDGRCPCNQGYITYPRRMMWWRAAGFCADDYFPEAGLGLYSPEALGAVVDEEGRPIDPATVALPEGYEDPEEQKAQRQAAAQEQAEAPADADELWALQERIARLPDDIQAGLKEAWDAEASNIRGFTPVPGRKGRPVLPASKLRIAKAMVNGWEGNARKGGADLDAGMEALRATVWSAVVAFLCSWAATSGGGEGATSSEEQPEPDPAPDTPQEAPQTQDDDQSAQDEDADGDGLPANPEFDVDAPDEEPPVDRNGAPEPDWRAIAKTLSQRLAKACEGVPDDEIAAIALHVKGLHWAKLNAELEEAGIPTDAHIDIRRMHASLRRLRAYRAKAGMDDVTAPGQPENPVLTPRPNEEPF